MNNPQPPIKEFRVKAIKAAIWEEQDTDQGRTGVRHSVKIQKRYKDKQSGEWKDTNVYFADDLPRLRLVADKAFEFVALRESEDNSDLPVVAR